MPSNIFSLLLLACLLALFQILNAKPIDLPEEKSEKSKQSYTHALDPRGPKSSPVQLTMKKFSNSYEYPWVGMMPAAFYTKEQALVYAIQAYNQLLQEENYNFIVDDAFNYTLIVASLYVPSKGFFLGSQPHTGTFVSVHVPVMTQAPNWWSIVRHRDHLYLHAEDTAMYWFERNQTTELVAGMEYPKGSYMAVYGHFGEHGMPGSAHYRRGDEAASEQNPCGSSGNAGIDPSCFDTLRTLGIKNKADP
jgi:hypothetical protein